MSKEFKMGFIEEVEPLKLTTIPKKYQKLIEATENRWFNKMQKLAKMYQKRIDELEHRLSNCIEPKFKVGQEVWFIDPENDVSSGQVWKIEINCIKTVYIVSWGIDYQEIYFENELFATEEEAKVKLGSLKDDNDRT